MKKRLLIIATVALCLPLLAWAASGLVNSRQLLKTNSDAATPARIGAQGTYATSITILGNKDWRTANTGTVYIGPTSTNNVQPIAITPGAVVTLAFGPDQFIDLYDWYVDVVTANDGVVVIYSK